MSKLEVYLREYSKFHQDPKNIMIHKVSVPAIMFSIFGIFKALPVPESWPLWLDWSLFVIFGLLIFYAQFKNIKAFLLMILFIIPQVFILEYLRPRFFLLCLFLFTTSLVLQFIGHKIEGRKHSFFNDPIMSLIGFMWVVFPRPWASGEN
jgi:uncharacterized membrane protein YGL010W